LVERDRGVLGKHPASIKEEKLIVPGVVVFEYSPGSFWNNDFQGMSAM
jgi:hypothetical protein